MSRGLPHLTRGERLVGGAGLVLGIAIFLPWYGFGEAEPLIGAELSTAWDWLERIRWPLLATALAAIVLALHAAYRSRGRAAPAAASPLAPAALAILAGLCALMIGYRVLFIPGEALEREIGGFTALAAALVLIGAARATVLERGSGFRQLAGRYAPPPRTSAKPPRAAAKPARPPGTVAKPRRAGRGLFGGQRRSRSSSD
ncbi:MAG TPA: hypothetical protein VFD37_05135 [Solirubrobacterales bacterium]|nr:hypothetical protein [Solirubrobacterales bacterium]